MHPLLAVKGRLALYLAAWVPVGGLLAVLMTSGGHLSWLQALALSLPMAITYAFVCLGSWYLCRVYPLRPSRMVSLLGAHLLAASLVSSLWVLAGRGWVLVLNQLLDSGPDEAGYRASIPLVSGVGLLLYLLCAAIHYLIIAFESAREAQQRALEFQVLSREADLKMLRAQIHPHFLFNSLNSISALTTAEPAAARRMCIQLAEFLRKSLSVAGTERIPLSEELALVDSFLAIEQVRLGARLQVEQAIEEESRTCKVPPLLLQPLVENAVNHGVSQLPEGGRIRIQTQGQRGQLKIMVQNSCDPERRKSRGEGVGLANVRGRLRALFESEARLDIHERDGQFTAELILPAVK